MDMCSDVWQMKGHTGTILPCFSQIKRLVPLAEIKEQGVNCDGFAVRFILPCTLSTILAPRSLSLSDNRGNTPSAGFI